MTPARARELIAGIAACRIGVVGDLMLDRYIRGSASRISPEAPVPVISVESRTATLGGAANVLRNLAALGSRAVAFGLIGTDPGGDEIIALCRRLGITDNYILRDPQRRTTEKTRIIADRQQVARVDDEDPRPVAPEVGHGLVAAIRGAVEELRLDGLIIEDYDKGVVTAELMTELREFATANNVLLAMDPHPTGTTELAGLTLLTPNRREAFLMAGRPYRPTRLPLADDDSLAAVCAVIQERWAPTNLLVTLGEAGMALHRAGEPIHHIPTAAREVFDVSGAGDTVIAMFTGALLAGADSEEAAVFANHAAGLVVAKIGTAAVNPDELLASF